MDSLIEHVTGYVETRIALLKLEMKDELAKTLSKALVYLVIAGMVMLFVLLISMAGAYKIA